MNDEYNIFFLGCWGSLRMLNKFENYFGCGMKMTMKCIRCVFLLSCCFKFLKVFAVVGWENMWSGNNKNRTNVKVFILIKYFEHDTFFVFFLLIVILIFMVAFCYFRNTCWMVIYYIDGSINGTTSVYFIPNSDGGVECRNIL